MTMYTYNNGAFIKLMPKSILISSLTMLKTWYDLVREVRVRSCLQHPEITLTSTSHVRRLIL